MLANTKFSVREIDFVGAASGSAVWSPIDYSGPRLLGYIISVGGQGSLLSGSPGRSDDGLGSQFLCGAVAGA